MPIFGSKDKSGDLACVFSSADVPGFHTGVPMRVTQEDFHQRLSIDLRFFSKDSTSKYLPYNQIISVGTASEKEIIEQDKSVIGRAAVGGLLLGPLGAVVGGLSGTGSKKKTSYRNFFIINYCPADTPDDIKVISFEIVGASNRWDKFIDELKKKIPQQPEQKSSQYL